MRVSSDMPDDVILLHDALEKIRNVYGIPGSLHSGRTGVGVTLHLKNCGTALRFLQVHLAKCYPDEPITLTGDPRLMERKGKPTSQTTSALILHGEEIPVTENESPYIAMTRRVMADYPNVRLEFDWSAAAFWYEYIAIHGGELLLEGLTSDSIQGDRIVADIYFEHFGVQTTFTPEGAAIRSVSPKGGLSLKRSVSETVCHAKPVSIDFTKCPDLYPAIAMTCEKLGIKLEATGTERLQYKESDRLEAVRLHEVRSDHRIAMALMAADYEVREKDQACISKSYPQFVEQYDKISGESRRLADGQPTVKYNDACPTITHITPIRGVNDDNLGKKHALSKLIHAATTEYVWLHDDDVVWPHATLVHTDADLIILPLRMESPLSSGRDGVGSFLLTRLQIAEYAAIQELTMRTAKKGRAVMCSGANLIVRREAWLACEAELHPEIPSGDDMFLLEAVKRRGMTVSVIDEPDYTAIVRTETSWSAFFRQRMRWAGKAPKYTDPDILRCGLWVGLANVLQLLCPLIILIKFPIEYSLIKKREPQTSWLVALLLEILYPFYMLVCLAGGFFRRRQW